MDGFNKYAEVDFMQHDAPNATSPVADPPAPPAPTRAVTPYVAVWAVLAVMALAYISVAVARPDILGATPTDALQTATNTHITGAQTAGDMTLEQKLAQMEKDLQSSLIENSANATEKKSHLDRIAALEAKAAKAETKVDQGAPVLDPAATGATNPGTAEVTSKQAADEIADRLGETKILNNADAAKNTTTLVKQAAKAEAAKKDTAVITDAATKKAAEVANVAKRAEKPAAQKEPTKVAALPKPKPAPKAAAKKTPTKLKTGSVGKAATKPITFGPAVVTRATRPIGVRIATGPSVDSLRLSWNALADRHGAPLRRLQPRYVTGIGATGLTYDLIAGPFNTANEASEVCARLHANGARCALGEFTGNAL